jgi:GT2 family glycosyltransferase
LFLSNHFIMAVKPNISIIIVSYNVKAQLLECLASLKAGSGGLAAEVIVVDNASSDGSVEAVNSAYPAVKLVARQDNQGFAAACNTGIRAATGEYPVVLNPDTEVEPGSLRVLYDFMESHPRAGIAGPKVLGFDGKIQPTCRSIPGYLNILFARKSPLTLLWSDNPGASSYLVRGLSDKNPSPVPALGGVCLILRREMLGQTGLLDERYFMYLEDIDLCFAAGRAGWEVWYHPLAVVKHHWGKSSAQDKARMADEHRRSMYLFFGKNHRPNAAQKAYLKTALWVHKLLTK